MAVELVRRVWCDPCQEQDLQTEGKEFPPIQLGNQKARVPMLCETHEKEIYQPFIEMLLKSVTLDALGGSLPKGSKPIGGAAPATHNSPPTPGVRRNPITPAARERGIPCIYPDCPSICLSRTNLGSHFRSQHDESLTDYCAENGIEVLTTMDGREVPAPGPGSYMEPAEEDKVAICVIKGCGRKFEWGVNSKRPRHGLSVHYAMVHKITAEEREGIALDDTKKLNALAKR